MGKSSSSPNHKSAGSVAAKATTAKAKTSLSKSGSSGVLEVEQRIIAKMAERYYAFGIVDVAKQDVVKLAGYKYSTNQRYNQAIKSLKAKGYIVYSTDTKTFRLTEEGLAQAPDSSRQKKPKTNKEYHAHLKESFEWPKTATMLELLSDGREHSRDDVCAAMGYKYQTNQHFSKSLGELRSLSLLESPRQGVVLLTDKAFPYGRPPAAVATANK